MKMGLYKKNIFTFFPLSGLFVMLFVFLFGIQSSTNAQCINTFPHVEDFETAPVWTAVSVPNATCTTNDWAWGTPNHTYVIQSAASGSKCWCVGGLTGAFYLFWEQSYLVSPCYDFTNLQYPHIKFKLFYDSEYHFDGSNLQSSIDGGTTWVDVGTCGGTNTTPIPEPTDCNTQNWYDYPGINYLNNPAGFVTSKHGWCGNTQAGGTGWDPTSPGTACVGGNGTGHWVTAEHCLTGLAGQPNVLLRFTFGAGYTCNNFDGIAFDSVAVSNGIINTTTITTTCGAGNTINFNSGPQACPTTTWTWNFGDATSGGSNTSAAQNPSHTFSGPGTYTVSVIASGGACNPPDTATKVVHVLGASITSFSNAACGTLGSATALATGGTTPTYSWTTGATTASITNLSAGTYTVFVTDPSACPTQTTVTITQASQPTVTATSSPASCSAAGSATASTTGGTAPYTYSWSPNGGTNPAATGLGAGVYTVTVTDNFTCSANTTVTVTNTGGITATTTFTNVSCNGGSDGAASVTPAAGTGPYSYTWSPGGGNAATANNLAAGTYTVLVSDVNSCTTTAVATITEPTALSLSVSSTSVACNGGSTGSANVTATGGTAPYTYSWSPSGGTNLTATGLAAGNYSVLVTDHNSCTSTTSVTINEPVALTATTTSTPANCGQSNGATSVTTNNGGTPGYTYAWSPSGGNAATASNLAGGVYSVTVTDANNCTIVATTTVVQSPSFSLTVTTQNVTCNGLNNGSATVTPQGGVPAYSYSWAPNNNISSSAFNLTPGVYTVSVTDSSPCSSVTTFTINEPTALNAVATGTATSCGKTNGLANVVATGGTPGYTYGWSPGVGNTTTVGGLTGGTYTVTVTDANGCTTSAQANITPSSAPVINFSENPGFGCAPVCALFSAVATTLPNDTIASWLWVFGDGSPNETGNNPYHCYTQSGSYSVMLIATDQTGCKDSLRKNSVINVYPKPTADFYATPFETDIYNPTIHFYDASQSNITSWSWTISPDYGSSVQNPVYTYQNEGTYPVTLIVVNASGCKDTITKDVKIDPEFTFYAPNCTTPNGDGKNEHFLPIGTGWDNTSYDLWIFDR